MAETNRSIQDLDFIFDFQASKVEEELWKLDANCVGLDTDMFFPDYRGAQYLKQLYATCNNCVVKQECIDYATKNNMDGFWGGTTPKQRLKLRAVAAPPQG